MEWACDNNQILRGAAVNSYITTFLQRAGLDESDEAVRYTCRICGAEWHRIEQEESSRAQLVRLANPSDKLEK